MAAEAAAAAIRPTPPPMPEPGKPVAEMTSEERTKYARSLQRWLRDQDVAAGRRAPKNMRETGIWLEGMRERDAAMDQLIADAEPDRHAPGADAEG
jgi:hypothetical protein